MPDIPFYLVLPMAWPYVISSRFNAPRSYPFAPKRLQLHEGIDFAPTTTKNTLIVRAAQRGIVDKVGFDAKGYGNFVRVVHHWGGEEFATWYGHLAEQRTKENTYVNIGDTIGVAGDTGNSTATHLHLTLQHIGKGLKNYVVDDVVDPEPFLRTDIVPFDEAWWVADATIPDGTAMDVGTAFRKTWAIRNAGTTTWKAGYQWTFFSDFQMNGPTSAPLPAAKPGEVVKVSVDLVVPPLTGTQRSTWKPRNSDNRFFDFAQYTEIQIKAPQAAGVSQASYVDDVTIPHDTPMKPGQAFRKTWHIRNTGQTEWGEGYQFVFVSDNQMGGPDFVPLPPTKPGDETDVSVDLFAPMNPGKVLSTWRPRDPEGNFFDYAQRTEIIVVPSGLIDDASILADVIVLSPGETFVKTWRVLNDGQTRWGDGYVLAFLSGDQLGAPATIPVASTKPLAQADLSVTLTAPSAPGVYTSQWQLHSPDGAAFGPFLYAQIEVKA